MRNRPLVAASIAVAGLPALLLAGCASGPETRVTRFHLNQPVARGQIAVEPMLPADRGSLEYQTYASLVGAELAKVGFSEAPGLRASEQVAAIGVERGNRESLSRGSGLSVGLGGGGGGWRSGVGGGVGVSFPLGGRPRELTLTRLVVQIKRRSDNSVVWEGRAETSARAGTPEADPATTVRKLAAAMFVDFPGVSGRTVTVR